MNMHKDGGYCVGVRAVAPFKIHLLSPVRATVEEAREDRKNSIGQPSAIYHVRHNKPKEWVEGDML